MGGLADATLLAAVAVGSVRGASVLAGASWQRRSPATAILLWQALGLAGGLAAVGALVAVGVNNQGSGVAGGLLGVVRRLANGQLASYGGSPLLAVLKITCLAAGITLLSVLWWMLVMAFAAVLQARRRQYELLALLAHGDPKAPGALVVDYPAAAAYCLPGIRSKIVVSAARLTFSPRLSSPRSWPMSGPTCAQGMTSCSSRSPHCAGPSRGHGLSRGRIRRWPCSSR
jgi:hypothetical protein